MEEEIREPDKVIIERLINSYDDYDYSNHFEYMNENQNKMEIEYLNEVIMKSMEDYYEDESEIFESYNNELMNRQSNVENIILKIKKVSVYDPIIKKYLR